MLNPKFTSFSSSFGNSAIEMIILDIKYHFTCDELTFHNNTLNCKDYNYVTNCLKIAHLHLRPPILGNCSVLARLRKLYQNPPPQPSRTNCSWIPGFVLTQTCEIALTENCSIWNFPATYLLLFSLKAQQKYKVNKNIKILKVERDWDELWGNIWFCR